jgi:signal transduction histidine kinase
VGTLRAETERLGRLVGDLLLLARFDEYGLTLRREDVDLDDLAYRERDRLAALHPGLRVELSIHAVRVTGDPDHLARVLRNLVDNAARYARTRVTLRVWADAGAGQLEVADDGPGIPPAERERIFDRFVRLDGSRTRADGGSGLGLPIVREIVTAHGGTITIADPTGDTGTLVRVTLPRQPPHADAGPHYVRRGR